MQQNVKPQFNGYLIGTIFCTKYMFAFKIFSIEVTIHSDNELDNVKSNFEPFFFLNQASLSVFSQAILSVSKIVLFPCNMIIK